MTDHLPARRPFGHPPDPRVPYMEIAAEWIEHGKYNRGLAEQRKRQVDWFGAELALARAEVREAAAELLRQFAHSPDHAAKAMHANAITNAVRSVPLAPIESVDAAFLSHTRARAWQWCAQQLDPSLPEVQARWD